MKKGVLLGFLAVATLVVVGVAPFLGTETLTPERLRSDPLSFEIFWNFRVPRVLSGLLAGGSLAVCGMVFQSLFRNPLTTPFTLGTASGAALGAAVATSVFAAATVPMAFGGAMLSLILVYAIARSAGKVGSLDMLLAGIAVSFVCSSVVMLLQYISAPTQTARMLRWTMGGLDSGGMGRVLSLLPWGMGGLGMVWFFTRELDLFGVGEETAGTRGVDVSRTRKILLLGTTLWVAAVVSFCGPIGFLGLMVPHLGRRLVGAGHRGLLPMTFWGGGVLLVLCDALARSVCPPDEIPVGILTAMLGGPFFIMVLIFRRSF
ncbi:MAG: iron ABC transporter permease [Planctomycetia bacterium]|nr:iron ABC transporter permease [Planctomycetia bacterium]